VGVGDHVEERPVLGGGLGLLGAGGDGVATTKGGSDALPHHGDSFSPRALLDPW
jgi:hypothetical protein